MTLSIRFKNGDHWICYPRLTSVYPNPTGMGAILVLHFEDGEPERVHLHRIDCITTHQGVQQWTDYCAI